MSGSLLETLTHAREHSICRFVYVIHYIVFFKESKPVSVLCYQEVRTDEKASILRVSEHHDLSARLQAYGGWEDQQVVITYGWLTKEGLRPRLVPLASFLKLVTAGMPIGLAAILLITGNSPPTR
jgi:hypothetical protein